jgi:hypothetical protein
MLRRQLKNLIAIDRYSYGACRYVHYCDHPDGISEKQNRMEGKPSFCTSHETFGRADGSFLGD